MFNTLYSRLALTLFLLLGIVGVILVLVIGHASTRYQQEVAQKLNTDLAAYMAAELPLMQQSRVNREALDGLFHQLMIINPSIELYLLDQDGNILAYSAPEGHVKRSRVDLGPVQRYIDGDDRYPLLGDDPRDHDRSKVFSAAAIEGDDGLQGYLYIVLGGEQYDHVVQMLGHSFTFDAAVRVLLVALAAALLIGLVVFGLLTRRLRRLGGIMRRYAGAADDADPGVRYQGGSRDEIDALGQQFNAMAGQISEQIGALKQMDDMRREMIANISHDLRTPLTTMRGYLETLQIKHDELSDAEREQYLQTALSHSQRLGIMVEELFELARLDSCETMVFSEPFSMCELVQDVIQKFELRAREKSVLLLANLDPAAPLVHGDIAMMQRVLENLLENGLRHTPPGGTISVNVGAVPGNVQVQVSDTGCGIPAEDVPRIFERFYQQEKHRGDASSAGLGLAIVKRILELHHSVINVSSRLDQGTTFSFSLSSSPAVMES